MARKTTSLWQRGDNSQRLSKAVRNFNAKIKRLENKNPEIKNMLPEKVTIKQMKDLIKSKTDLDREIKSLERFTAKKDRWGHAPQEIVDVPGNDNNLKTTRWQRQEMGRMKGTINRKRNARLKELQSIELERKGKKLGYSSVDIGMGKIDESALKPINAFTPKMSKFELNKKFEVLRNESQSKYWDEADQRLRNNYINTFMEEFGDSELTRQIKEHIEKKDFKEFYRIYRKDPNKFEHLYFSNLQERQKYLNEIMSVWGFKPKQENLNINVGKTPKK